MDRVFMNAGVLCTCLALTAVTLLAGCGPNFGTIPVQGRVTFQKADPPALGYLYFVPVVEGPPRADGSGPRSASAMWSKDGTFQVGTFRAADGLRPGRYEVRIECLVADPNAPVPEGQEPAGRPAVAAGFRPPELVVPADAAGPLRYDIDVPQ